MPRVDVPVTSVARAGVSWPPAEVTGDATNNHSVANGDGKTVVVVRNANVSTPRTVTFRIPKTVDGQTVTPVTRSVAASTTQAFGTFDIDTYGTPLQVDVEHADLKLYAFRAV